MASTGQHTSPGRERARYRDNIITETVLFLLAGSILADLLLHPQNDSFGKSRSARVGSVDGSMQANGGNKCECKNNPLGVKSPAVNILLSSKMWK